MKSNARGALALVFVLVACGGQKKAAAPPSNATEPGDAAEPRAEALREPEHVPSSTAVVGDDDVVKPAPACAGFDIPDLLAVVSNAACEAADPNAGSSPKDLKDLLDVSMSVADAKVPSGGSTAVTIVYKNKGKAELPLYFVVDPEPRFEFQAYTLKGARADNPPTPAPPLPPEVTRASPAEKKIAKVTLAPQGTAKLTLTWDAVKHKWASKERAKGALPGRGYPREPAGPLRNGKYILRVVTPLTGVLEGVDHEISQPRTQVTVGAR